MVALALPFAYLHARAGGVSLKVFGGIMLGISFVLLNNVAGHIGLLRDWTPWVVAAAPSRCTCCCRWPPSPGWCATDDDPMTTRPDPVRPWRARPALGRALRGRGRSACARARPGCRVRAGLPGIHGARPGRGRRRAGRGRLHAQVDVLPLFLGAGGHVRKDLPPLLDALRAAHPAVRWSAAPGHRRSRRACVAAMAAAALARCRLTPQEPRHEPAPVPLRPGGGAPQPEPDRDRQGAVHLAARHLQGHPRAGRRARRRHLRAPRQAPAPRHRARASRC